MAANRPHPLERIQYWQGQMLRAGDLRTQQTTAEQLRWWHNRSLHDANGIGFGLTVTEVADAPVRTLEVACGIAYDCFGHEIILPAPRRVVAPTPPTDDKRARILLIRYSASVNPPSCCEGAMQPCWPTTGSRLQEDVELAWKVEDQVQTGDGVPLFRLRFDQPNLADSFQPTLARPLARAQLASGETIPGNTPWEVWHEDLTETGGTVRRAIGMQTRIDTSAAGFTSTPCYFAQLMGPLWDRGDGVYVPAFFSHIADATPTGFTFRLLMRGIARHRLEAETQVLGNVGMVATRKESSTGGRRGVAVPERAQGVVRVGENPDLRLGDQLLITAHAGSAETGPIFAVVAGLTKDEAALDFGAAGLLPQLAGQLSAVALFNPDFGAFFTAFARRQKLHVCWLGCQGSTGPPKECPGLIPVPQPCDQIQNSRGRDGSHR